MSNRIEVIEPLIEKRREQENIIKEVEGMSEKRHEILELLKQEETIIRAKDANAFNSFRRELPEGKPIDEVFDRNETFPIKPEKEIEKTVVKTVAVEKEVPKEVPKQTTKKEIEAKAAVEHLIVYEDYDDISFKDCIKGLPTWLFVFGGIILLAGVQTAVIEIIEGGIRSVFVWVMMLAGIAVAGVGAGFAMKNRKALAIQNGAKKAGAEKAGAVSGVAAIKEASKSEAKDAADAPVETEIVMVKVEEYETVETTEIVNNENYDKQYEEYKQAVLALLQKNVNNQKIAEAKMRVSEENKINAAKEMIAKIDRILYPGVIPVQYEEVDGERVQIFWNSDELDKVLRVVKSGTISDIKEASKYYAKYKKSIGQK